KSDWMEQAHLRGGQPLFCRELERLAYVAQQHVRALDVFDRYAERLRNCFFDQAFFQSDPQIAGHDLDDVLGFERRDAAQELTHKSTLGCGSARGGDTAECLLDCGRCTFSACLGRMGTPVAPILLMRG